MMPPSDQRARDRALDHRTSFIVQAPAGSGKTELLIQRYLKLLATVEQPEAIAAITFTRKAAGEMRARVMQALRNPSRSRMPKLAEDVRARDREMGWRLLENPSRMRVQTIDALCAYITRQMPWLAGFGAQPEITEKPEDLYREAARNTLLEVESEEHAGIEGPISRLLLHLDNDFTQVERLIAHMLEKRDQWLRHTSLASVRSEVEQTLSELVERSIADLHNRFPVDVLREMDRMGDIPVVPAARLEDRPVWQAITELLLTKKGAWLKRSKADLSRQHLERLQKAAGLLEALQEFCELPPSHFDDSQWLVMEAVIQILPKAVAHLQVVFRERGRVDFAELAIRASAALGPVDEPSDLALSLGYRFEHLLVDEFQDTSYTQYELLKKLTAAWEPGDGRTLFLVGDPMQSIYRFRQAEVSLFLKARKEGIGPVQFEALTLTANFRSMPAIIDWVNDTFETIFGDQEHIERGIVAYSASVAQRIEKAATNGVTVHAFIGESQVEEANRILSIVDRQANGTIGILVRARSHLAAIVSALKSRGIPFQAIEIDQLGERAVIQDLMALTLALLHPADRISWLAILRAPWCGLQLEDLHAIAAEDQSSTIWDLLHTRAVSAGAHVRLARIQPVLESAMNQRGRIGLRNLVEQTWRRLGGLACVEMDSALDDAAAYLDMLEGLEQAGDMGEFQSLRDQVKTLFAQPDPRADGRLQVMTIHKAKGLEFDTVILPGLGQRARAEDQALLTWSEQEGKLLFAPIAESGSKGDEICKYLARVEKRTAENEVKRLLYVAATRARGALHLLGCARPNEKAGDPAVADSGSFLKLLWPAIGSHFVAKAIDMRAQGSLAPARDQASLERIVRRVPEGWSVPPPTPAVFWNRPATGASEASEFTAEWQSDALRHAGTVVHAYLQRIAREGLQLWNARTVAASRDGYHAMLRMLGVPDPEVEQARTLVETALLKALHDPRGQWVLAPHLEAQSEYSVTGLLDGKLCQAAVDRTFVDEAGVRWIIDYKTSSQPGGDVETFLEHERERHREQLERYARLLAHSENRPIRLGLYFPIVNGWREWAAGTIQRRQASLFE